MASAIVLTKTDALIDGLMNVDVNNESILSNQISLVIDAIVKLCNLVLNGDKKAMWLTGMTGKGAGVQDFVKSRTILRAKLLKIDKIRNSIYDYLR
jgi:hypothetical protein